MNLVEVLKGAGCKPRNHGTYITCSAKYRGGDDPTSVAIYLQNNIVKDFVTGRVFSLEQFLTKTLNLKSKDQLNKILNENVIYYSSAFDNSDDDPFNKQTRYYSNDDLVSLEPNHTYWNNRGISDDTLKVFKGGLCSSGKMKNRYVFPIFNSRKKIEGFTGRDTTSTSPMKWKHIGKKTEWAYPLIYTHKYVSETNQLIIVESIGDMLSLWESDIKNTAITFGTDLGGGLLKAIIRLDPKQIVIATNNDKNNAGQIAAEKMLKKLGEFFDAKQVIISHPIKNDFGEQSKSENHLWLNSLKK